MAKQDGHKKLTTKQKRFCEEYVTDFNATQAAIRAGYSKKTSRSQAQRLLTKVDIQNYVAKLQEDIRERNKITIDECISILADIARFDIAELYDKDGALKPIHEIPKRARTAISSLESEQLTEYIDGQKIPAGILKKVRTMNKDSAVDKLIKYFGGYEKDNNQKRPLIDLSQLTPEILLQIWNARLND